MSHFSTPSTQVGQTEAPNYWEVPSCVTGSRAKSSSNTLLTFQQNGSNTIDTVANEGPLGITSHYQKLRDLTIALTDLEFWFQDHQPTDQVRQDLVNALPRALISWRTYLINEHNQCATTATTPPPNLQEHLTTYACACIRTLTAEELGEARTMVVSNRIPLHRDPTCRILERYLYHVDHVGAVELKAGVLAREIAAQAALAAANLDLYAEEWL